MQTIYKEAKAWPFEEARRICEKIEGKTPQKGYVLFETGYGPSGLPHIGTFGEVVRTSFVQFAFECLTEGKIPTKLFCISDDLDGMRKVPENMPNYQALKAEIGKPLTSVPDPFGEAQSYGHYMNAKLRSFLDSFDFKYDFFSATELYKSGRFNEVLLQVVKHYNELMALMMKNLGEERQATYSPLMPICPKTGKVLAEGVRSVNPEKGTITYVNEFGEEVETEVTNGKCKMQWKIDFGARWQALGVDYEIFGKDHAPNAPIYQQICKILGGEGPINFVYELFLGEDGAKISKSKGNGITVDEWLKYAPRESLALFMFIKPKTAKRLYFDTIPKMVDEYMAHIKAYSRQNLGERVENPAFFIHSGQVPEFDFGGVNYSLLLNLVAAANPESDDILWGFIAKYNPELRKGANKFLDKIVQCSIAYYNDFIKPHKAFREPSPAERAALLTLHDSLAGFTGDEEAEEIQKVAYKIGMDSGFELRSWFSCIYEVLLGQKEGPRVGTFIKLYGIKNMREMIKSSI